MGFLEMLGDLLSGGADAFGDSYGRFSAVQQQQDELGERRRITDENIRANQASEAERTALRLEGARRDMNARDEARRRARTTGKVTRSALSTTERGRNILLSGAGELDDESLGQADFLRNFDDIMRAITPPSAPRPTAWQPTSMEDELQLYERKKKLDRQYDRPRASTTGTTPQAGRILSAINPQIDDTARDLKRFEDVLSGMREEQQIANLMRGVGGKAPPSTYTPADTAGYGAAQNRMRGLERLRGGATMSLLTGEPMPSELMAVFTEGATNRPTAAAQSPTRPSWTVPGLDTKSDDEMRRDFQSLVSELVKLNYSPERAEQEARKRFGPILQTRAQRRP